MRVLRTGVLVLTILVLSIGMSCYKPYEYYEYYRKGVEYGTQEKFKEAQMQFEKALNVSQPCPPATFIRRRLKIIDDVIKEKITKEVAVHLFNAIDYINKTISEPGNVDRENWWGVTYRRTCRTHEVLDEAINECKKVIAVYPDYEEVYLILGIAYHYKEMYDKSISEYKKALAINPRDAIVRRRLSFTYLAKEMLDEAAIECEKALFINPEFVGVHETLAEIYYLKKEYELAIEHCEKLDKLGCMVSYELLGVLKPYDHMGKLRILNSDF